ncbi:MAG: hypothetical protein ACT452_02755 [Microthrixaceae bacterium]
MERKEPVELEYTRRYGALVAQHSIQDLYDLLVELITNCDDSYHGLFTDGTAAQDGGQIVIEIEPHRGDRSSVVTVKDRAAGFADMERKLKRVGERTSREGDRGFMARGLKDCAAIGHVTVETIVDGRHHKAEITPAMQLIEWGGGRKPGQEVTNADRERLGIKRGNGTVVRVDLEPHQAVPRLETLKRDRPWHFALRDIMAPGSPSSVKVSYAGSRAEPLSWTAPEADLVHDREYAVPGYEAARFRFRLWKAHEPLEDPADKRCRRSGILVQGKRGIHGVSFLAGDLEGDPAAEHYFGRIECSAIDDIAEEFNRQLESGESHSAANPRLVLDPNRRGGLEESHPFTRALYQQPVEVLKAEFKKHRETEKERRREVEAKETTDRLRRLAREASKFMRDKLEEAGALTSGEEVRTASFMKAGVGITPAFTQIPTGATKTFTVRASRELDLPMGTIVKVVLGKAAEQALEVVGEPNDLGPDPVHDDLQRGSFVLRGLRVGKVQVGCQVDGLDPVFAEVQVVDPAPVDVEIPGDFAFTRKTYMVRPGATKRLLLRARFDHPVAEPPAVKYTAAADSVVKLRQRHSLELVDGTTYYEGAITVEGRQLNGKTVVRAEIEGRSAECTVVVAPRDEEGIELTFELVDYPLGQNYRATWDRDEPNKLQITTQHESISRYLGSADDGYPGQHSEAFRVLLAELISDNVCRRIVAEQLRALPMEIDADKVYVQHNRLMREFTPIAHRVQLASPGSG